ncbi:iron ABC transporter permease [Deferribacter thermophilus]|uniref:FecCD family ABC transporter permease n=1 Tax=Deferribacter thermophilus TaxID=53573 RepID=UPI003C1AA007
MNKFIVALIITIIIFSFSLTNGAVSLNNLTLQLLLNVRLPRVLTAFIIGGMLSLSGSILQLILRNPLADGFTTGISASAALGAAISIGLGLNISFTPIIAILFALIGLYIVFRLTNIDKSFHYTTIILAGIILNIICSAIISFLKYYFDESLGSIIYWLMGGFYDVSYLKVFILLLVLISSFLILIKNSFKLNILAYDYKTANSLGIDVAITRKKLFIIVSILIAFAVSFSGIIGFVGLIIPHIVRGLFKPDMKTHLIYSTLFGANFLLLSDTVCRIIIPSGAELPVGVATSFFGGVFFLFLMKYKLKNIWYG